MRHIKKAVSIVSRIQIQPCFHGTSLHLTELTDDVSLCSFLVEHTYLSAFFKTIIIVTSGKNHFHEMNGDVGMAG